MEKYKRILVSSALSLLMALILVTTVSRTFKVIYAGEQIQVSEDESTSNDGDNDPETDGE